MNKILSKKIINEFVTLMVVDAPMIAKKAHPGQFVILRAKEKSERIPLTIADHDEIAGMVTIVFQVVGASTYELNSLNVGDYIHDFTGPLGKPTETDDLHRVAVIGGGVGCAIAYPIAKELHAKGCEVHSIIGFRSDDLVFFRDEFAKQSETCSLMTDDGSAGEKGLVTDKLKQLIESGLQFDKVIAIGPLVMMKYVSLLTKQYGIQTVVSMNPIMIDGTGMCGGCRLTVGGKMMFACVDGPEFDGHEVDFDEAIKRSAMYKNFEKHSYDRMCNLLKKEVE